MKEKTTTARIRFTKDIVYLLVLLGVVAVLYWFFGCPIKYVTGLSCPGCGMTRAAFELLHFNFAAAFHYHPLFWLVPLLGVLLLSKTVQRRPKVRVAALAAVTIAFFVVYLVRLFWVRGDVVNWSLPPMWQDMSKLQALFTGRS